MDVKFRGEPHHRRGYNHQQHGPSSTSSLNIGEGLNGDQTSMNEKNLDEVVQTPNYPQESMRRSGSFNQRILLPHELCRSSQSSNITTRDEEEEDSSIILPPLLPHQLMPPIISRVQDQEDERNAFDMQQWIYYDDIPMQDWYLFDGHLTDNLADHADNIGNFMDYTNDTGISEDFISRHLKTKRCCQSRSNQETEICVVCQAEYEEGDEIGILGCGHEYHVTCITKWLQQKNLCPICKRKGLNV